MTTEYCITFQDVEDAARRIKGIAHRTPVLSSESISVMANRNLFFKVEAYQRTGSFKFRGALNTIGYLLEQDEGGTGAADSNKEPFAVVAHSSGNHAQAVALATKLSSSRTTRPLKAYIAMPKNAPDVKRNAVVAFGGQVVTTENTNEAREAEADRLVQQYAPHSAMIHPSEEPKVIAGQGTVCLEFIQQLKEERDTVPDVVIIPVGGGGLASGNTIALRALLGDKVRIVLAEPSKLDDAKRSFEAKTLLKHDPENRLDSVADGLKTTLGPNTWPIIRDLVDDIFTVSEQEILAATKLVWERLKVCIEPSAGVGVAVALSAQFKEKYPIHQHRNVGCVLCGGNVDILKTSQQMHALGL